MRDITRLPRHFANFEGRRLAYAVVGNGPPVLLLHGLGGSADFWLPVIDTFKAHFTLICPDLLGFGLSDKPVIDYPLARHAGAIAALLRHAGLRQLYALVGHSAGGVVAAALANLGVAAIGRVALVSSPYPTPRFGVRAELVASAWFNRLIDNRRLARADLSIWHALWPIMRRVGAARVPDYLRGGWVGFLDYSADSYYDSAAELLFRANLDLLLPALAHTPVLLLHARDDRTVPVSHFERLRAALPHAQATLLESGGHYAVLRNGLGPLSAYLLAPSGGI